MALIKCPDCQKDVSDKAEKCPFCGCPIRPQENNTSTVRTALRVNFSSKQIIIAVSIIAVAIFVICLSVIIPKQKESSYEKALILLENGKYEDGRQLLLKNPNYKDTQTILEEIKYESCAYSAVSALKKILKNPDSVTIYAVDFYGSVSEGGFLDDPSIIIDNDHPFIVLHYGAQNGFGGITTGYCVSTYNPDDDAYEFLGCTDNLNIEDLDKDDDDYLIQMLTAAIIKIQEEDGEKVGTINIERLNKVLKNSAYTAVKIITE